MAEMESVSLLQAMILDGGGLAELRSCDADGGLDLRRLYWHSESLESRWPLKPGEGVRGEHPPRARKQSHW